MEWMRKPEVVLAVLAVLVAFCLVVWNSESDSPVVEEALAEKGSDRRVSRRAARWSRSKRPRPMPPLSNGPTGEVVSVHREYGFAVVEFDQGKMPRRGTRAYVSGLPKDKVWLEVESSEKNQIIANVLGAQAADLLPGDRVEIAQETIVIRMTPSVRPSDIRWTNPDDGGWAD